MQIKAQMANTKFEDWPNITSVKVAETTDGELINEDGSNIQRVIVSYHNDGYIQTIFIDHPEVHILDVREVIKDIHNQIKETSDKSIDLPMFSTCKCLLHIIPEIQPFGSPDAESPDEDLEYQRLISLYPDSDLLAKILSDYYAAFPKTDNLKN